MTIILINRLPVNQILRAFIQFNRGLTNLGLSLIAVGAFGPYKIFTSFIMTKK